MLNLAEPTAETVAAETEAAETDESAEPSDEAEVTQQLSMEDTTTRKFLLIVSQLFYALELDETLEAPVENENAQSTETVTE